MDKKTDDNNWVLWLIIIGLLVLFAIGYSRNSSQTSQTSATTHSTYSTSIPLNNYRSSSIPSFKPITPMPQYTAPSAFGYVDGTCKELKAMGLGNFGVNDPNYTDSRDRDNDGVACEE